MRAAIQKEMQLLTVSQDGQSPLDFGKKEPGRPFLDMECASLSAGPVQNNRGRFRCKGSGPLADAEDDLGRPIWDMISFARGLRLVTCAEQTAAILCRAHR